MGGCVMDRAGRPAIESMEQNLLRSINQLGIVVGESLRHQSMNMKICAG